MALQEPSGTRVPATVKLHFYYIVGMLLTIIIALLSVRLADLDRIPDYISVAGNLTSLVLAILAIVYAYFSNFSLTESLANFSGLSSRISDAAKEVSDSSKGATRSSAEIASRTTELVQVSTTVARTMAELSEMARLVERSSAELRNHAATFPSFFEDLGRKIEDTQTLVKTSYGKVESSAPIINSQSSTQSQVMADESYGEEVLRRSSPAGLLFFYACSKSLATGKVLHTKLVSDFLKNDPVNFYAWAWLVCSRATGILRTDVNDLEKVTVVAMNPAIAKGAREAFLTRSDDATKTEYAEALVKVDMSFASADPSATDPLTR
jgi:hypothetical protein